jgi:uncharacterized protein YbgA (DUF1722 family)
MLYALMGTAAFLALMHAFGHFKERLSSREKGYFLEALDRYRATRIPLSVPVGILRSYVVRFEEGYLEEQAFFEPYPEALVTVTDSGKGRMR